MVIVGAYMSRFSPSPTRSILVAFRERQACLLFRPLCFALQRGDHSFTSTCVPRKGAALHLGSSDSTSLSHLGTSHIPT
jgi:hypothetical protein